ncbi:MAG TPA: TRAP transporter large permease, partial [Kiloniellales bacterium]|nr:TRAP transporter large permease [Kiloniellales bacterium]
VGHFRGGLAMSGVLACMLFAAVSGSSPATVVAIGSIAIAGMVQAGYSKEFAAGVICNAGTLGILIPPSIVMVVYAAATDQSVGRLFLAGVIPGAVAGLMLMVGIYLRARMIDLPRQERTSLKEWLEAFGDAVWGLLLIIIIMGGIYGGIFTPTEAAAVAAVYAFFIACFVYRDIGPLKERAGSPTTHGIVLVGTVSVLVAIGGLSSGAFVTSHGVLLLALAAVLFAAYLVRAPKSDDSRPVGRLLASLSELAIYLPAAMFHRDTRHVLVEAGKTTIMLLFIIANAMLFAHVLTTERIPHTITEWIINAGFEWWSYLIIVNILLLIAGNFMEPSAILLIMAPILFPIAVQLGIDPIHLGIIMVVNMEIGMITPPVGLNLFVTAGITGMNLLAVVRAALPWLGILLVFLVLVTYVPWLSTFLPNLAYGPLRL